MNEKLEIITIQICPPKAKSFFVNTWYRPPDASTECFDWYGNCIKDMDFEQMIREPTRVTATSRTLIDLAFCNKPKLITMSGVGHLGISDNSLVYVCRKISIPRNEPKVIRSRQFKHYNKIPFLTELRDIMQYQMHSIDIDIDIDIDIEIRNRYIHPLWIFVHRYLGYY